MEVDARVRVESAAALIICALLASTNDRERTRGREAERQDGRNGSIGALLLEAVTEWGWLTGLN